MRVILIILKQKNKGKSTTPVPNRILTSKTNLRVFPGIVELYLEQRVVGVADDREIVICGHRETANGRDVTVIRDSFVTVNLPHTAQTCWVISVQTHWCPTIIPVNWNIRIWIPHDVFKRIAGMSSSWTLSQIQKANDQSVCTHWYLLRIDNEFKKSRIGIQQRWNEYFLNFFLSVFVCWVKIPP